MLFGARIRCTLFKPVAGLLLALFVLQLGHEFAPDVLRSLLLEVQAATGFVDPNGDIGTNTGARSGACSATTYTDCVDDAVRSPTSPGTGDFIVMSSGNQNNFNLTTLTGVATVTAVAVSVSHNETRNNMTMAVALVNSVGTVIAGPTNLTYSGTQVWQTVNYTGLSLTQTDLDGLRIRTTCTQTSGGPARECNNYATYATVTYDPAINVLVSANGTQQDLSIGTTAQHVGGAFLIRGNIGNRSVTSITIAEQGTVDAQADLSNARIRYEIVTSPFTCTYNGSESFYGTAQSFSGANGTVTFTGSVGVNAGQGMCIYPEVDVDDTAGIGQTLELQITNPTTNISFSDSPIVSPATAVLIPGTTILRAPDLTQERYHWRNDDGSESAATSATGGSPDTSYDTFPKSATKRLRVSVSNEGNATTSAQFRLEYATKVTSCSALTDPGDWTDVGAGGGDFDMSDTGNLTDGNNTTNIATSTGGMGDPNTDFESPNAAVKDTSSQTASITLDQTDFVEIEYAIVAVGTVSDGTTYCFRVTDAGTALDSYTIYPEATIAADVQVTTEGTQTANVTVPVTNQYAGGVFALVDSTAGANTLTSVTITASGTVDIQNDLSNIVLRYDTTTASNCAGESYASTDTQYGATSTSFNGSNQATFTGSASISPSQTICLYVVYSADSDVTDGELLDIQILNPSTDVVISGSSVAPASLVDLSGMTTFAKSFLVQGGYHWRNNNGDEGGATSATGGSENTALSSLNKNSVIRLRTTIGNTGQATSQSTSFRLEWAQKVSSCAAVPNSGWERVDTTSDEFQMVDSGNLTDGNDTTDVAVSNGGVSNPAGSFDGTNGGVKDTSDTTAAQTIASDNYIDLEFSISATDAALQGASYCFRATSTAETIQSHLTYAEVTIALSNDFKIQRGSETITGTSITLTAGTHYETPTTSARAFIRITNTQHTGAGPNTGNSNNNADDVTAYISNGSNLTSSVTIARPAAATGNTRVDWEIIEYVGVTGGENEIIVRDQAVLSYTSGDSSLTSGAVSGIADDADVVVFITGQGNDDTGRNSFHLGQSTAAWNAAGNTVTVTRGATGASGDVSYAVVEFTGSNWAIQRVEHTYTAASSTETESITAVNSQSRAFIHAQKRTSQNNHADYGHEVWLSGLGQVSFLIDNDASTPGNHTSVAWVIENKQTLGEVMDVTRSEGTLTTVFSGPESNILNIGKTLTDISRASLFVNNKSNESQRSWPEPILAATLSSSTQYELWRSDTTAEVTYHTEVVEWPTAARKLEQNYFRFFVDNELLLPGSAWPTGTTTLGENEEMTGADNPMRFGSTTRIRMTLTVTAAAMPAGLDSFNLEYGKRTTASCGDITAWLPLGAPGSTTAQWRGVDHAPVDGTALSTDPPGGSDLLISIATVAGTYEEANTTALNPYTAFPGDEIEYDWVVQHNGADDKSSYCFRMVEADGSGLSAYNEYPVVRTVGYDPQMTNWQWFDDETNLTPSTALAAENIAPADVQNQNAIKLRVVLRENSGAAGPDTKFSLQYSEYADFSQAVFTVASSTLCTANSLWCYYDGAGADNATLNGVVISNADSCIAGVGNGCGTHNESISTTTATRDQTALSNMEFEFTIQHAGARAGAVYYFRLFDEQAQEIVPLYGTSTYPSLVTQGAQLVFSVSGINADTSVAGVITDATTTAAAVGFGSLPMNTSVAAAQQININTNATDGYQVLTYAATQPINAYGDILLPINASNTLPVSWGTACVATSSSCVGYHTTDGTLAGESTRFAPFDSYAALHTNPEEIMYSSVPANDTEEVLYRMLVTEKQVAGEYETSITYLAVPVF